LVAGGWLGDEPETADHFGIENRMAVNTTTRESVKEAASGRLESWRTFLAEVRNELKRVTWPSQKEVYATTIVVILTSVFFGVYLFALDFGLNTLVQWVFRRFGAA
jgi:preprotein translocase subunit SecE